MKTKTVELVLGMPEGCLVPPSGHAPLYEGRELRTRPQLNCRPLALLHGPTDIRLVRVRREECWDPKSFKMLPRSRVTFTKEVDLPLPWVVSTAFPGGSFQAGEDLFLTFSSALARPALLCETEEYRGHKGRLLLGLETEKAPRHGPPVVLVGRPEDPLRIERLVLECDDPSALSLFDLRVGNRSQLINSIAIPGEVFASRETTPHLWTDVVYEAVDVTVMLANRTPTPQYVRRCVVYGTGIDRSN
jgi:hypothetical protein